MFTFFSSEGEADPKVWQRKSSYAMVAEYGNEIGDHGLRIKNGVARDSNLGAWSGGGG